MSGINQLLIDNIFNFLSDTYLMLISPIVWIWKSRKANWQGWGERKERAEKFFLFVRKPDPLHDLLVERAGEQRGKDDIKGRFSYIGKRPGFQPKSNKTDFIEESIDIFLVRKGHAAKHCVIHL